MLGIALVALQAVPLPPSVWPHLGSGRAIIADGYRTLGLGSPWLPISLAPYASLGSLFAMVPALALFVVIVSVRAYRASWLAAALLLGTIAGVVLGALQVSSSSEGSRWYIYEQSNFGFATGFFANANHMADLLVCTLPFLAALLVSARGGNRQRNSAIIVGVAAAALVIFVGIAINRSLAVYGFAPAVLAASALILIPQRSPTRRWWLLGTGLLVIAAIVALATSSVRAGEFGGGAQSAAQTREEMLATTARAMGDFLPWGSGLGSFQSVYHLYEDPAQVTDTYVIHAHDDYIELALETGVPGILLMVAFLAWWARRSWAVWRFPDAGTYARAASIASAAILLHSIVDFPLRTAAISAVFGMCLALLAERTAEPIRTISDLRPTRHVVFR
jgi:O-antigen ligase